jgi:hypothetical protein
MSGVKEMAEWEIEEGRSSAITFQPPGNCGGLPAAHLFFRGLGVFADYWQ